jgi:CubicO group peptidase (beta-lactamase class C family)
MTPENRRTSLLRSAFGSGASLALVAFAVLVSATRALPGHQAQVEPAAAINNLMRQLHERGQFNGVVLVAQNGKIVYRGSFGPSDRSPGRAYTPDTPSCLASVSKPMTALAIMMLADKRRLAYDDPIAKYFPELPEALGAATVRQLLHHTSGIPDYEHERGAPGHDDGGGLECAPEG